MAHHSVNGVNLWIEEEGSGPALVFVPPHHTPLLHPSHSSSSRQMRSTCGALSYWR